MSTECSIDNKVIKGKTIICIVGRSGSGKTTLAGHLKNWIPVVSSRTTRKPRAGEVSGEAPYHHFVTTKKYIYDVVTNVKVGRGDLSRGDDLLVADTTIEGEAYWATASDVFGFPDKVVAYVIDPTGVANLKKAIDTAGDLIINYGYAPDEAPNIFTLANSRIAVLYVNAVEKVLDTVPEERKNRDSVQELGWDVCKVLALFNYTTPYIEDLRERNIFGKLSAHRLAEKIKHFYGA